MTRWFKLTLFTLLATALVMGTFACAKKPVTGARPGEGMAELTEEEAARLERAGVTAERAEERGMTVAELAFEEVDVFFGFDRYDLTAEAKEVLASKVAFLNANPGKRALIEGHCDERGSNEYNLALGERRASSARDYLIERGISPDRIDTISWGEERPQEMNCSQRATANEREECWARNRRAHFSMR